MDAAAFHDDAALGRALRLALDAEGFETDEKVRTIALYLQANRMDRLSRVFRAVWEQRRRETDAMWAAARGEEVSR